MRSDELVEFGAFLTAGSVALGSLGMCVFISHSGERLRRRLRWPLVLCTALPLWGCGDDGNGNGSSGAQPLVTASAWEPVDEAEDPFADEKSDDAVCDSLGYETEDYEDEPAFFVDTEACDYLTVEQPALVSAAEGDTLHLRLYQYDLTAPDGGQAHLAIAFGEDTVWEEVVDIPADAELIDSTWEAEQGVEAGDPILFHVSNHGDNNYALIELSKMN